MLTADTQIKMLGNLRFGSTHTFTFTLTNNSDREITIDKVVAGCNSCTKTSLSTNTLQSGEQATLSVSFTPGSVGINSKNLTVLYRTGNVQRPNLGLQFKAMVNE